ncbi:ADP-heptose:LPS heptosyltransferase [Tistlia consotensis]|uniref:ADP-heptose:LPS heptosyltransferase n=1 Tax=Tistlia consotensis USBA 355 TaxID=560819 RepID=A0A1Y6CGP6_9PROT|nr:glycosyltransferase family 9 protein [Tistlia consotensis]SMF63144.1 ADP-heptose:LPS heptosyltransferase [Tistlia consotensis USBA 355]SNR95643.1 ADP-heptose:LPS heptosyltransferase [Tistlia consotensis]
MRRRLSGLVLALLALLRVRRPGPQPQATPRRVAIVRFGGLGDVVVATGLAQSVRRRWPEAEIVFVTGAAAAPLLAHHPAIDRLAVVEPRPFGRDLAAFRACRRQLAEATAPGVDLLLFLHNDLPTLLLAGGVPARWRAGHDVNGRGFGFRLSHPVPLYVGDHPLAGRNVGRHLNELFHDLLRGFLGQPALPAEPPLLRVTDAERAEAEAWLSAPVVAAGPAVLLPCGTDPIKLWPAGRYAELAEALAEDGRPVVVLGGPAERTLAPAFASAPLRFAAGELTLRRSLAVLSQAALVVGNDTGLLHAAAALGQATLGLFGPTAWWAFGYAGDAGRRNRVLRTDLPCVPCFASVCRLLPPERRGETPPCLDDLAVGTVAEAARALARPAAAGEGAAP